MTAYSRHAPSQLIASTRPRVMKLKSTPSRSPSRAGRDVYDRDIRRCGVICTSRSTRVVLPVPDGADTMNRRPRCLLPESTLPALLDILDLLAHLLELGLCRDDHLRDAQPVGL